MKKTVLLMMLFSTVLVLAAQKPIVKIQAFQRYYISGVAPTPIIEIGSKETAARNTSEPEYFIYLIACKVPDIVIESIWIKQHLYQAAINKVACKPVVISNGRRNDTLVQYTDDVVWQISITGKGKDNSKPKNSISAAVSANELVVRLHDKNGRFYTRSVKNIAPLESERGQ